MIVRVQVLSVCMFNQFLLRKYSHISAKIEYMHKLEMLSMLNNFFGWGVQAPYNSKDVRKPQGTNAGLRMNIIPYGCTLDVSRGI